MNSRMSKIFYYLGVAEAVSKRSTCLNKHYGAIIVQDDAIRSTGYNGSPRGDINCCDQGVCYRVAQKIPRGTRYETCRSAHGEANAIISAAPADMKHATMYLYGYDCVTGHEVTAINSCIMCKRLIINAGIDEVIYSDPDIGLTGDGVPYHAKIVKVQSWLEDGSLSTLTGY